MVPIVMSAIVSIMARAAAGAVGEGADDDAAERPEQKARPEDRQRLQQIGESSPAGKNAPAI